jgi:hypothetical protein
LVARPDGFAWPTLPAQGVVVFYQKEGFLFGDSVHRGAL